LPTPVHLPVNLENGQVEFDDVVRSRSDVVAGVAADQVGKMGIEAADTDAQCSLIVIVLGVCCVLSGVY
jgi:hypothetical protein